MSVGLSHHLMPPASFLPLLPSRFLLIFKILGKWHLSKNPLLTLSAWCQSLNPYSLCHPVWHLIICCHLWFTTSLRFASYCSQKVNAHGLSLASHRIPNPQAWLLMRLDQSFFFFFLNYYLFIYLFLAVLGLRFCARAFSSCGKRGPLFIVVRGPLTIVASLVAEHRLQTRSLSSCGSRA